MLSAPRDSTGRLFQYILSEAPILPATLMSLDLIYLLSYAHERQQQEMNCTQLKNKHGICQVLGLFSLLPPSFLLGKQKATRFFICCRDKTLSHSASVCQTYLEGSITRNLFVRKSIKRKLCKEIASRLQFSGSYGSAPVLLACTHCGKSLQSHE